VRDRHTGKLAEVPLSPIEAPLLEEGDLGLSYAFRRAEEVEADHEAVLQSPHNFVPVEQ
jgi:hypothetical protein